MKFLIAPLALACSLIAAIPAAAQTIYTSRAAFNAATTGQVTTDFEQNGPGGFTSQPGATFTGTGFSISSSTILFTVDPDYFPDYYQWNSGDVLDFEFGLGSIVLDAGVTAFGFDFGNPSDEPGSGVITINGIDYAQLGQPTFNFFGIVGAPGLGPININFNGGLGILDNATVAVAGAIPEPATWAFMILGFGAVGGALRQRKVKTAVRFA